jgi:hypothetical protein
MVEENQRGAGFKKVERLANQHGIAPHLLKANPQMNKDDLSERIASLSPEKLAGLLTRLGKAKQRDSDEPLSISRSNKNERCLLSFPQEQLWLVDQMDPGNPAYNVPIALRLEGALEQAAFHQAFNEIIRRHEIFRAYFPVVDAAPAQLFADRLILDLKIVDLRTIPEPLRLAEAHRLTAQEAVYRFNLGCFPLLRLSLVYLGEADCVAMITMHHIVVDAWSLGVFSRELVTLYGAFSQGRPTPLPELTLQYADFARWQRRWFEEKVLDRDLFHWRQQLGSDLPVLDLPTDRPLSAIQTPKGGGHQFLLPTSLYCGLKELGRGQECTLFMTLLAAFQILLSWYTGQDDIVVGSPIDSRDIPEFEPLIGCFTNTVVLRTDLSTDPSFITLLHRVRVMCLDAYKHRYIPFTKLVEILQPKRHLNRAPLFEVTFSLENGSSTNVTIPGLNVSLLDVEPEVTQGVLLLEMWESADGLGGHFTYNKNVFYPATIVRLADYFETLLHKIIEHPEASLSSFIQLLNETDTRKKAKQEEIIRQSRFRELKSVRRKAITKTNI